MNSFRGTRTMIKLLLSVVSAALLIAIFVCTPAMAQETHRFGDPQPGDATAINTSPLTAVAHFQPAAVAPGGTTDLVIDLDLSEGYHAYLERFKLSIESPDDLKLDQFKITPLVQFMDVVTHTMKDGAEKKSQLHATVEVPVGFKAGAYIAKIKLTYQACTTDHCLFPKTLIVESGFTVEGLREAMRAPAPTPLPQNGGLQNAEISEFEKALGHGTVLALLIVFGLGFLASLTPCIYPMIPITLAVLGAHAEKSRAKSFSIAFVYVLGIALTYSVLGVIAAQTGALFGSALSNVYVVSFIAVIFVVMGLSMYGFFEIQVPAFVRDGIGTKQTGPGYVGAFLTGLIAGVVASPCVGPVLVSILAYIAQTKNLTLGFVFLFVFALGLGVPFLVLGTFTSLITKIPRAGRWMELTKFIFGSVMLAMALYYIRPIYPKWLFHLLEGTALVFVGVTYGALRLAGDATRDQVRRGFAIVLFVIGAYFAVAGVSEKLGIQLTAIPNQRASENELLWHTYSPDVLHDAETSGKPVLIDFYADWCAACVELDRNTFPDERIRDLSNKFTLVKVDATEDFAGLDELKSRFEVRGLPTLIFMDKSGAVRKDLTLTGFENADAFLKRMKSAL